MASTWKLALGCGVALSCVAWTADGRKTPPFQLQQALNGFAVPPLVSQAYAAIDLGDLDGDGIPEYAVQRIVGIPNDREGTVSIRRGADSSVLKELRGDSSTEDVWDYGRSLALGDVDGDGRRDLLVGNTDRYVGLIHAYDVQSWALIRSIPAVDPYTGIGFDMCSGFDYDRDGCEDVLVGAEGTAGGGGQNAGAVVVMSGRDGSVLQEVTRGERAGEGMPSSLDLVQFDGDGSVDFLIGSALAPNSHGVNVGRALVVSGTTNQVLFETYGKRSEDLLGVGITVRSIGDRNGDDLTEFCVDSWAGGNAGLNHEIAMFDPRDPEPYAKFVEYESDKGWDLWAVRGPVVIPDVDGDGRSDLMIGMVVYGPPDVKDNKFLIFSAVDGTLIRKWNIQTGRGDGGDATEYYRVIGDLNCDGRAEILVSSYAAGESHPERIVPLIYSAPSLRLLDDAESFHQRLLLTAPRCPGGLYQLLASTARHPGVALGSRTLPLALSPLLNTTWSMFVHGWLDANGEAVIDVGPPPPGGGGLDGIDIHVAWIGLEAGYENSVSVISNAVRIH